MIAEPPLLSDPLRTAPPTVFHPWEKLPHPGLVRLIVAPRPANTASPLVVITRPFSLACEAPSSPSSPPVSQVLPIRFPPAPPAADIGGKLRCGAGISTVVLLSVDHHVPAPGGQVSVECAAVVRYGADAAASPQREGARQGGRSHRIVLKCQDIGG